MSDKLSDRGIKENYNNMYIMIWGSIPADPLHVIAGEGTISAQQLVASASLRAMLLGDP